MLPRERVFGLICDLSIRPAFTDHMFKDLRLERVDPVGVGAGARFRIGDDGAWLDTVIEEVESPHTVREHGHGGRVNRLPVFTVWELAEGPGPDGCEVTVSFWAEPRKLVRPAPQPARAQRPPAAWLGAGAAAAQGARRERRAAAAGRGGGRRPATGLRPLTGACRLCFRPP